MRSLVLSLLCTLALILGVPAVSSAATERGYPTSSAGDPPGANDWGCVPSAARPVPVILVHGTFGDRKHLLERLSRSIKTAGHCVYSLDYGNRGTGDIVASAKQLKRFTNRVLAATGAAKVSLVGHSQGGMMPRYYIKFLGGAKRVDDLIGIAPSNHGTNLLSVLAPLMAVTGPVLDAGCRACNQQSTGSRFLRRLNRGDETPGRVRYTQITTRYDQIVVPHKSGYLAAGPRTTNVTIQDVCAAALSEHLLIPTSKVTIALALNALGRKGPLAPAYRPPC